MDLNYHNIGICSELYGVWTMVSEYELLSSNPDKGLLKEIWSVRSRSVGAEKGVVVVDNRWVARSPPFWIF